jgi:hypothetical protein
MGVYARANQAEFEKDVLWLHAATPVFDLKPLLRVVKALNINKP